MMKTNFMSIVDVEYALLPSKCERCGQLKHKFKHCLQSASESLITTDLSENPSIGSIVVAATETKKIPTS